MTEEELFVNVPHYLTKINIGEWKWHLDTREFLSILECSSHPTGKTILKLFREEDD